MRFERLHGESSCYAMLIVISGQINGLLLPGGHGVAQLNSILLAMDFENNRIGEEIVSRISGQIIKLKIIIDYKKVGHVLG